MLLQLSDWLKRGNWTQAAFAAAIGDTQQNVQRYCLPEGHPNRRIPRPGKMRRIWEATRGEVDPNSFYGINGNAPAKRAAALKPGRDLVALSARARKGWRTRKAMQKARAR